MDRRESLKSLFIGSLAGGMLVNGCAPEKVEEPVAEKQPRGYGRTPGEKLRDEKLLAEQFFTQSEMETLATLCDIILPPADGRHSATDAGVPEFVEFMVKDIPRHQLPLRGGLMWLDHQSNKLFGRIFTSCNPEDQLVLCDLIAFPDKADPGMEQGVRFFSLVRDLTLTGFYTTRMGIDELGYKGNTPNVWDGVPDEVLQKHGLSYEKEWLAKCIDQSKRADIAEWDEDGNLLT